MKAPRNRWIRLGIGLLLLGIGWSGSAIPAETDDLRALVGVKVFTAFVAADQELQEKAGRDGRLHLLLLYHDNREAALEPARRLAAIKTIRGLPVTAQLLRPEELPGYTGPPPAGIFIAEWLPDLAPLLAFAQQHRTLVFSPLLGDMARGVHGGIYVSDRILPVVNEAALNAAAIHLKPFFLDVAKHYEPQ